MSKRGVKLDGQRLVQLYQRRGWSQQELARKSGLDARTITKVKNGGVCDASTHQCLAMALGVPPEELLVDESPEAQAAPAPPPAMLFDGDPQLPTPPPWAPYFYVEQIWKIIDLRKPYAPGEDAPGGVVWDLYRVRKLDDSRSPLVLPYLTWGERIDCLSLPPPAEWRKVPVEPGDLVHSEKQWEVSMNAPEGPPGTLFDCGPIQLRFVNAFHGVGQQWWQVRVAYAIQSLVLQVLFSDDLPCRSISGDWAAFGQRRFTPLPDNQPYLLPDHSLASWHIPQPRVGAFYKLSWSW